MQRRASPASAQSRHRFRGRSWIALSLAASVLVASVVYCWPISSSDVAPLIETGSACPTSPGWSEISRPQASDPRRLPPPGQAYELLLSVSVSPEDDRTLFAGGYAGLYATTDCGATWRSVPIPTGSVRRDTSLRVLADGLGRLYAWNGRDPLLISHDSGSSWSEATAFLPSGERIQPFFAVMGAASLAQTGSPAFATSFRDGDAERGLYPIAQWRSGDGGQTWEPVGGAWLPASPGTFIQLPQRIVAVDPLDRNAVYATSRSEGLSESFDGGLSFRPEFVADSMVVHSRDSVKQVLFAADGTYRWLLTSAGRILLSHERGVWVDVPTPPRAGRVDALAVNPHDPLSLLAIAREREGVDGGRLWMYRRPDASRAPATMSAARP